MEDKSKLLLSGLRLSSRVLNALKRDGIETIGDLIGKTEPEVKQIRNMGSAAISELKEQLHKLGLSLKEEEKPKEVLGEIVKPLWEIVEPPKVQTPHDQLSRLLDENEELKAVNQELAKRLKELEPLTPLATLPALVDRLRELRAETEVVQTSLGLIDFKFTWYHDVELAIAMKHPDSSYPKRQALGYLSVAELRKLGEAAMKMAHRLDDYTIVQRELQPLADMVREAAQALSKTVKEGD